MIYVIQINMKLQRREFGIWIVHKWDIQIPKLK